MTNIVNKHEVTVDVVITVPCCLGTDEVADILMGLCEANGWYIGGRVYDMNDGVEERI